MIGLIRKDLLCLRRWLLAVLLLLGAYVGLCIAGKISAGWGLQWLTALIPLIHVQCFLSDRAAGWDAYARTLPVSPEQAVTARYLTAAVLMGGALLFSIAVTLPGVVTGERVPLVFMLRAFMGLFKGMLLNALLLPLLYRFGAERAKWILSVVLAAAAAVVLMMYLALLVIAERTGGHFIPPAPVVLDIFALFVVGPTALAVSHLLSVRFYEGREL